MNQTLTSPASVESILTVAWSIPIWIVATIALLSATLAAGLYMSERGRARRPMRWLLAAIRFLLLMTVLWMLAGWSWQQFKSDRPELIVVLDRSSSMNTRDVGDGKKGNQRSRFERAVELFEALDRRERQRLLSNYEVQWYALADALEPARTTGDQLGQWPTGLNEGWTADGVQSRLGDGLLRLLERQSGKGTAAIVFVSDGINTSGAALSEAAKAARRAAIPLHTVTVGRQRELPDLRLADLLIDREVYLGDQVTAEIAVLASDVPSAETRITLRDQATQEILDEINLTVSSEQRQRPARLTFVPKRAGQLAIRVEASAIAGEQEFANNSVEAVVNVQDKTIRVLLVSAEPSYEFRFLKSYLERVTQTGNPSGSSFELRTVLQDADPLFVNQDKSALRLVPSSPAQIADYDVFVLADLNPKLISQSSQQAIYNAVTVNGSGCMFVSSFGSLAQRLDHWPLGQLLPIQRSDIRSPPAAKLPTTSLRWQPTPLGSSSLPMQLASSMQESLELWKKLPEFAALGRAEQVKPGAQILSQALDRASGETSPLLITQFAGAGRVALQATDETYRWASYQGSDLYYQRYWGQMLRWLSRGKLSGSGGKLELTVEPKQSAFGQSVRFQVNLGASSAQVRSTETVELAIESPHGRRETLRLALSNQASSVYQAERNDLLPGSYRAVVVQPLADSPPTTEFTVTAPPGEQASLRANVEGMQMLAQQSRGKHYLEADASELFEELPPGKPTRLGALPSIPIWNSGWAALFFVALITLEWLLRRRNQML